MLNLVYLNNSSTTKVSQTVIDDFVWCAENIWHNPSDISQPAMDAKNIIRKAQEQIAASINAKPEEIIFTSGASEANNWAIKGYLDRYPGTTTIITTEIEHPSVYNVCLYMKDKGYNVLYAPIDEYGRVDVVQLEKLIIDNAALFPFVSIMMANNEIGTLNDIAAISKIVHNVGGTLHVDAVQGYMHTKIDVEELGIDMMSTSFHKFGGFKGIGFLYVRQGIELTPLIHGGHQFDSKRSGTENVPMIYAMGNRVEQACLCVGLIEGYYKNVYNKLLIEIKERCSNLCDVYLNGHPEQRLYNNISLTFDGIDAATLIALLEDKGVYVSAGSACNSGEKTPSRVLKAIGLSDDRAFNTIRISPDWYMRDNEIDKFVDVLAECIETLKMLGN